MGTSHGMNLKLSPFDDMIIGGILELAHINDVYFKDLKHLDDNSKIKNWRHHGH